MASCTFDDGPCFLTDINGQDTMDWRKAAVSLILYFVCNFIAFAIFFFLQNNEYMQFTYRIHICSVVTYS